LKLKGLASGGNNFTKSEDGRKHRGEKARGKEVTLIFSKEPITASFMKADS
jgi:hypothetical protein